MTQPMSITVLDASTFAETQKRFFAQILELLKDQKTVTHTRTLTHTHMHTHTHAHAHTHTHTFPISRKSCCLLMFVQTFKEMTKMVQHKY